MKKLGIIGLGVLTAVLWATVLTVYLTSTDSTRHAESHSLAVNPVNYNKAANPEDFSAHFTRTAEPEMRADTIIGNHAITKDWAEDVKEDGKLSIDTLLKTLNLVEKPMDNS